MTRLVGTDNARNLLIDTKTILADEALQIGLATQVAESALWDDIIEVVEQRSSSLPLNALHSMMALTAVDTRVEDMTAVVATAGVPGLKQRILDYKERLKHR